MIASDTRILRILDSKLEGAISYYVSVQPFNR